MRRRKWQSRSGALFERMVDTRDPEERARLRRELSDLLSAETLARHGPPDPNGEISTVKGRFPIEVNVVGHVFPDGTSIDYGRPLDAPRCLLPGANSQPPVEHLQAPWVFRLPSKDEDA